MAKSSSTTTRRLPCSRADSYIRLSPGENCRPRSIERNNAVLEVSTFKAPNLQQLRRYAIARSLFEPISLRRAIARLGFVQADPMRAPARAQDLILAYRVKNYRVGQLEQRYSRLAVEEGYFLNYGFLPRKNLLLLHPRAEPI